MLTAVLFLNAPKWKQLKYPSTDEINEIYPNNAILLCNKMEWNTDKDTIIWMNLKTAQWKKQGTKDHILYDFIYMIYPEKANHER